MAEAEAIIIKRVKKGGHDAHHGGAWKVAYADFVTAMMAFFLLLWLLNATTEAQKQGIADYFSPTSVSMSSGGAGGMLGGQTISSPGAMTSRTAIPSISIELKPTTGATDGDADVEGGANDKEKSAEQAISDIAENAQALKMLEEKQKEIENAQFEAIEKEIRQAIQKTPDLKDLEQSLLIDRTPDGLRIQVVDREGKPMFKSGSAEMLPHTKKLLAQISTAIKSVPNKVRITGHTDSVPFRSGRKGYGNWELSGDRAQASRRELVDSGLDVERVESVAGRAARDPLLPDDPESARNRRIGILLLRMPPPQMPETGKAATGNAPASAEKEGIQPGSATTPAAGKPTHLDKDWTGPRIR